jgi:uncharacterized membrane protein YdfJ with MMPL/SSD domain
MQRAMDRLSDFVERHRRAVVAVWVVALVASLPFAMRQTEHLTSGGFAAPGSGSQKVDQALQRFPDVEREGVAILYQLKRGAGEADLRAALKRLDREVGKVDHIALPQSGALPEVRQVGERRIAIVPLRTSGARNETADAVVDLRKEVVGTHGDVKTYLVGQQALWAGMQDLTKEDLAKAESAGFPIVLLILLAVFGSLAAATLPLALGFASVMLTGAEIFFLSQAMQMSIFTTNVASMIGIGVAVDYSLFVLARYREEIQGGAARETARRTAMRTSGIAVAFSGITVLISLAGLFLVDSQTLRSMALGAIVVVSISILGAITLLPALMTMLGRRAYARGRVATITGLVVRAWRSLPRRRGRSDPDSAPGGFWHRWTEHVMRRPVVSIVLSATLLLALAVPALSLDWGNGALRQFPKDDDTRVGVGLAASVVGEGAAGPALVVADFDEGDARDARNKSAVDSFVAKFRRDPGVASVGKPHASEDGRSVLIQVVPKKDFEGRDAEALLARLRTGSSAQNPLLDVATVDVGGATAFNRDFIDLIQGSLWKILLFVLAFSYLVLLVLLRSALLPLKAVLMNLLSVAAAYGVLVMVFQYGWFDGFMGFESLGYVNAMTMPFLLAIVFGLSMDYEVFLLTRIRERYQATGDTKRAVAEGLQASARTITSAALIMVAVFGVFALTGVPSIKEIGLGLAVAIALDATLVRLVLVPATMEVMGRWNWWLPRPLERLLPRADFEGAADEPRAADRGRDGEAQPAGVPAG